MDPLRRAQIKAKREHDALRDALSPQPTEDHTLTVGQIDAELTAISAELTASCGDDELTPKLHELADDWLDMRLDRTSTRVGAR